MGIEFTEAQVQRVAKSNEARANANHARYRKQEAPEESPEEDEDDEEDMEEAWKQHREEKAQAQAPRSVKPLESATDWYNDLKDWVLPDKDQPGPQVVPVQRQAEPTPEPEPESSPVVKATKAAIRRHRARTPTPQRRVPHRSCTGVWIPKQVYEDPRFASLNEIVLYLEINHLDHEDGCTARNQHFADFLGCSIQTIQDMTERKILSCIYPSRRTRIIHIAGGRRSYPRHRG
jgi:hypothetical protein